MLLLCFNSIMKDKDKMGSAEIEVIKSKEIILFEEFSRTSLSFISGKDISDNSQYQIELIASVIHLLEENTDILTLDKGLMVKLNRMGIKNAPVTGDDSKGFIISTQKIKRGDIDPMACFFTRSARFYETFAEIGYTHTQNYDTEYLVGNSEDDINSCKS